MIRLPLVLTRLAAGTASLALLAACSESPDTTRPVLERSAETAEPVDGTNASGSEASSDRPSGPGVTLDRILATRSDDRLLLQDLQPAQTVRAEPTENRHVEGQIDTVRTYVYDGIEIEVYDVAEGRAFIQRVEVTSPPYETSGGIAVGQTRSDIEAVYGSPVREDGPVAIYEMGEGPTPTTVEVRYSSDGSGLPRAESITWRPYVD